MTSVFTPTPPATQAEAHHMMAEVLEEMDRISEGADNAGLFKRLLADGADSKDLSGIVLNWIELRFGHLFNMVSIVPDAEHADRYFIWIRGTGLVGPDWKVTADLPKLFCEIHEGWWS